MKIDRICTAAIGALFAFLACVGPHPLFFAFMAGVFFLLAYKQKELND